MKPKSVSELFEITYSHLSYCYRYGKPKIQLLLIILTYYRPYHYYYYY